jgi:hypothetical protein
MCQSPAGCAGWFTVCTEPRAGQGGWNDQLVSIPMIFYYFLISIHIKRGCIQVFINSINHGIILMAHAVRLWCKAGYFNRVYDKQWMVDYDKTWAKSFRYDFKLVKGFGRTKYLWKQIVMFCWLTEHQKSPIVTCNWNILTASGPVELGFAYGHRLKRPSRPLIILNQPNEGPIFFNRSYMIQY